MLIEVMKTQKIRAGDDLYKILDMSLPQLEEKSIVVIASNIIGICQNNVVKNDGTINLRELIKNEADYYYEDERLDEKFGILIPTIKKDILIANAGVDESNADGYFVLWPQNLQQTTNEIWEYLRKKQNVQSVGVIVSDSRLVPLRTGTLGVGIAWCGFSAVYDYIGRPDIFGRKLQMTKASILDGLAASAVLLMGEGDEQTPLAVIADIPFVQFQNRSPTQEELSAMNIPIEFDIFGKMLTTVNWEKGGKS